MYKVEYIASSLEEATKIAQDVVSRVEVPMVWIMGPDVRGIASRTIACVERTRPSWILSVATEDERAKLVARLDPVEVMG